MTALLVCAATILFGLLLIAAFNHLADFRTARRSRRCWRGAEDFLAALERAR